MVNVASHIQDDPVVSPRADVLGTYVPEHDDHREYLLDHIVSAGLWKIVEVLYKVRWYDYRPEDDPREPLENVPANLINRYGSK